MNYQTIFCRIWAIISLIFSASLVYAQSEADKSYYRDNIDSLDPIEGIWDIEDNLYVQSRSQNFTDTKTVRTEIKRTYGNKFKVTGSNIVFERIGDTNGYTLTYYSDIEERNKSLQIVLESNGFSFKYSTRESMSSNVFRADTYRFIKSYPTRSMYEDSFRRKYDKEQQALEAARKAEEEKQPKQWTGTGFALTNNYIVTNYHVVEDAKTISIQGINGNFNNKYNAAVVASDKFNDLALLRVNGVTITTANIPYSVKTTTSDVGEDVFVLGYPLTATMGDEVKLTTGVVSSKTGFQGDVSLYQISAPIQPGNSGGPLFDGHGNVIGIVSAKHRGAENVGYAIKASYLRNLMESAVSTNILPQNNKISGMNLSGKVKAVKNYVYYITCSSSGNVNAISSSSSYSGNSTYSSSTGQTFSYPSVNRNLANNMKVVSISLQDNQTVLTLSDNNRTKDGGYYSWFTLDKNAYIVANGQRYTLKRAEGIALSPDKTYFSYAGETKTFTLYFPPIPKTTTSIDFIESADSEWKLYGIQLR